MKNIIITGTSRGIGLELAQYFANNNCNVLALSRNSKPLETIAHKNITPLSVDITEDNGLQVVENYIKTNWKQVHILIEQAAPEEALKTPLDLIETDRVDAPDIGAYQHIIFEEPEEEEEA